MIECIPCVEILDSPSEQTTIGRVRLQGRVQGFFLYNQVGLKREG